MSAVLASPSLSFASAADDPAFEGPELQSFDDRELEEALKAVSWNARDVSHFLRSARVSEAAIAA